MLLLLLVFSLSLKRVKGESIFLEIFPPSLKLGIENITLFELFYYLNCFIIWNISLFEVLYSKYFIIWNILLFEVFSISNSFLFSPNKSRKFKCISTHHASLGPSFQPPWRDLQGIYLFCYVHAADKAIVGNHNMLRIRRETDICIHAFIFSLTCDLLLELADCVKMFIEIQRGEGRKPEIIKKSF